MKTCYKGVQLQMHSGDFFLLPGYINFDVHQQLQQQWQVKH